MDLVLIAAVAGIVWLFVALLALALCRAAALADAALAASREAAIKIRRVHRPPARIPGRRAAV